MEKTDIFEYPGAATVALGHTVPSLRSLLVASNGPGGSWRQPSAAPVPVGLPETPQRPLKTPLRDLSESSQRPLRDLSRVLPETSQESSQRPFKNPPRDLPETPLRVLPETSQESSRESSERPLRVLPETSQRPPRDLSRVLPESSQSRLRPPALHSPPFPATAAAAVGPWEAPGRGGRARGTGGGAGRGGAGRGRQGARPEAGGGGCGRARDAMRAAAMAVRRGAGRGWRGGWLLVLLVVGLGLLCAERCGKM